MNINIPDFKKFKSKEKLSRIKILFGAITKIVKKDTGILKPTYSMAIFSFLKTSLFFTGVILMVEGVSMGMGILMIFLWLLLGIYKYWFFVKRKALQSILLHQSIISGSSDFQKAKQEYKSISGKLFFVGLTDFFIEKGAKGNLQDHNFIIRILFSILEEVWDLLKNFMIPVVAIEKKSIKEAVKDLKILKSRVPEVLLGVLGFDFIGSFLVGALFPIFVIILFLTAGVSYGVPFVTDIASFNTHNLEFSLSAIILGIYIIILITNTVSILAVSVKTVYFTIFYMMLKHPEDINEEIAPKLIEFIEMKESEK
jgi:hypothetical protein